MYAYELAEQNLDDFILFYADQTVQQVKDAVASLKAKPTALIVAQPDARRYLFSLTAFERAAVEKNEQQNLSTLFNIAGIQETLCLDPYDPTPVPLQPFITQEEDFHITGYYDPAILSEAALMGSKGIVGSRDNAESWEEGLTTVNYLQSQFPSFLALHERAVLQVWITGYPGSAAALALNLPPKEVVDIIVESDDRLSIFGGSRGRLFIPEGETDSAVLNFEVQAVQAGQGRLKVICLHQGLPLGTITITTRIRAEAQTTAAEAKFQAAELASTAGQGPDLTLLIMEEGARSQAAFTFYLYKRDTPDCVLECSTVCPHQNPQDYYTNFLAQVERMLQNAGAGTIEDARMDMELRGEALFVELFPADLRQILLREREKLQTIHILSRDSWIPWEMIFLTGEVDGEIVTGKFLCEYQLTRWNPDYPRRPEIRLDHLALIHPTTASYRYMDAEAEFFKNLSTQHTAVQVSEIEAQLSRLVPALEKGGYNCLHFTGHGRFVARDTLCSSIALDGGHSLYAQQISGRLAVCGKPHPLVFLNACQTAIGGQTLTGVDGWANQFLSIGAAGFLGTHWSIDDRHAFQFASSFYQHLLNGRTVGEAALQARLELKPLKTLNWLAYTVYSDPFAHLPE